MLSNEYEFREKNLHYHYTWRNLSFLSRALEFCRKECMNIIEKSNLKLLINIRFAITFMQFTCVYKIKVIKEWMNLWIKHCYKCLRKLYTTWININEKFSFWSAKKLEIKKNTLLKYTNLMMFFVVVVERRN